MTQQSELEKNKKKSAHDRIVDNYYEVTSSRVEDAVEKIDFSKRSIGIKRGLGNWIDVNGLIVVDLGSGTGELCWLAKKAGAKKITGINLSSEEIAFASKHVPVEFIKSDVIEYLSAQATKSIDRIYALNLLEHLSKDQIIMLLDQANRCLKNNGELIAMVPNATSSYGSMTRYWDITHQIAFTPSSVKQIMRLCKFNSCEFREWGPRAHGIVSSIRFIIWKFYRLTIAFRFLVESGSIKGGIYTSDMIFKLCK